MLTDAPSGPFSSGQTIEVKVAPNSTLAPSSCHYIEECAAPGGATPTSPSQCDAKTYQHDPLFAGSDGSLDYQGYAIYSLPDSTTLGETAGGSPPCDPTDQCVLYVGRTPRTSRSVTCGPRPFSVHPSFGDDGSDPGTGTPEVPFALALPIAHSDCSAVSSCSDVAGRGEGFRVRRPRAPPSIHWASPVLPGTTG